MKKKGPWRKEHIIIQKSTEYEGYATGATDKFRDSWQPRRSVREIAGGEKRVKELLDKDPGE